MPERIQRKRAPGWKMPENTIYVGRTGGSLDWGNPFRIGMYTLVCDDPLEIRSVPAQFADATYTFVDSAATAVALYRKLMERGDYTSLTTIRMLRGKDLACWCPLGQPCHADVLLELANSNEPMVSQDRKP